MLSAECLWTNYIRMDGGRDRELYLEIGLHIHFFFFHSWLWRLEEQSVLCGLPHVFIIHCVIDCPKP